MCRVAGFLVATAAFAVLAGPTPTRAQPAPTVWAPPPQMTAQDLINYCIYENRLYSIGAGLCFGRLGYVCVPPSGPATGNRAYWTAKDDQLFSRPVCN